MKYIKGLGNLSFRLVKRPKKEQVHCMTVKKKSRNRASFEIFSYLKESVFTAVNSDAKW